MPRACHRAQDRLNTRNYQNNTKPPMPDWAPKIRKTKNKYRCTHVYIHTQQKWAQRKRPFSYFQFFFSYVGTRLGVGGFVLCWHFISIHGVFGLCSRPQHHKAVGAVAMAASDDRLEASFNASSDIFTLRFTLNPSIRMPTEIVATSLVS